MNLVLGIWPECRQGGRGSKIPKIVYASLKYGPKGKANTSFLTSFVLKLKAFLKDAMRESSLTTPTSWDCAWGSARSAPSSSSTSSRSGSSSTSPCPEGRFELTKGLCVRHRGFAFLTFYHSMHE